MSADAALLDAVFAAGPLGLGLTQENVVASIGPGGQAEKGGVRVGDLLVAVADKAVRGAAHDDVLALVKAQARPMTLQFERPAQAEAPSAAAAKPMMRAPSLTSVTSASAMMMKNMLGGAVQAVRAIDSTLNKAIDDSAKQAKVRGPRDGGAVAGLASRGSGAICSRRPRPALFRRSHPRNPPISLLSPPCSRPSASRRAPASAARAGSRGS